MSVLQRKAQAGKQEHQARAMTVPKALRVSLAKIADQMFDMALAVIGATQERCGGDALSDKMDDASLLVVLDGPRGNVGGAVIGAELVAAMIQQQTTGKVAKEAPAARPLTSTDAALCAPLLDALFQRSHGLLEEDADRDILCPYKFGARVENARLFGLALDANEYHIVKLTIDVAGGAFQSNLTLILPVFERAPEHIASEETGVAAPAQTLEKSVMSLRADLTAVLGRLKLPLDKLSQLVPGDVLTLKPDAFDTVEIMTCDRRVVSRGAMGQIEGQRAIQLDNAVARPDHPARRAEDREGLDLPQVDPLKEAPGGNDFGGLPDIDIGAIEHEPEGLPDLPDLPALEGEDGLPDLSDLPGLSEDTEMAALPDLSDLPGLSDEDELPSLEDMPDFKIA
ncbi:flagellar motor switch protein FliM [uncultured Roseobacter sp.]|uniref:flagellar motor switch protein FliM n=1 Tax=uncultured Roseobacter sp. TaxID=114847 RepID=UPI0026201152|nr:flagellar motor switch protein FliM [uncultured Roseobacter sp.]